MNANYEKPPPVKFMLSAWNTRGARKCATLVISCDLCNILCPEKAFPWVKYSNTHNSEQKSLKIIENTLTSIWTLCTKLQVGSVLGSWYYYLLLTTHQKWNLFKTETISVKSNEQFAKQWGLQMVLKMSTVSVHTLAVVYATDNHVVLIKWKMCQCWRHSIDVSK